MFELKLPLGELEETTRMLSSPARPEIQQPLPE